MRIKISSLITAISIVLLIMTTTFSALQMYPAKVYGNPAIADSVSMSPTTLTLTTLPQNVTYLINVTSAGTNAGTDYINNVSIALPTGWTYAGSGATATGYGFGAPTIGNGWLNFTTSLTTFYNGTIANFSIPVAFSLINQPTTVGIWNIYCYQGNLSSTSNPIAISVSVSLQFHSTMTPNYVMNGTSYIYTVTITNDACTTGITNMSVTFPAGTWIFNVLTQYSPSSWTVTYNSINTFILFGPNILEGNSVSIMVNMTVPVNAGAGGIFNWTVGAISSTSAFLGNYTMPAVVDTTKPTIAVNAPIVTYYSDGSGNYIWINVTVHDTPNIQQYGISVSINDTTRFQPYAPKPTLEVDAQDYVYYYVNVSAIPDGHLAVLITAVDPAGNTGTGIAQATVDNTIPALTNISVDGYDVSGTYPLHVDSFGNYWMTGNTTNISVYANFSNPSGFSGNVYFNSTIYTFANATWLPSPGSGGYPVSGSNLVILNITLTDGSLPNANRYTFTWNISRDTVPPSALSYTNTTTICGGFIIWGLSATDNVGINNYNIYHNGSLVTLSPNDLMSSILVAKSGYATIANTTVLNLQVWGYMPGDVANITITVVDYGSNVGPPVTFLVTVLAGQWYPIVLYPNWNLVSLPLLPSSTATANIYSLLLANGAAGVKFTYGYDNVGKAWSLNPATMTDGNGYWIDMKAYDVLIVQGYLPTMPPGTPPPIVQYSLKAGWNFAGFTSVANLNASTYVTSLQTTPPSYFRWLFAWNPQTQQWIGIDTATQNPVPPITISPGQGFWVYTYSDQTLIPPP